MQQWFRQRNTTRRDRDTRAWPCVARPGARFRQHLRRAARAAPLSVLLLAMLPATVVAAAPGTGTLFARTPGGDVPLPHLGARFAIDVSGPIARTTLSQRFRNDGAEVIEAVYRFPLPDDAAVDHLSVTAGGRRIVGEIRPRERAKAEYRAARDSGRRAALVSSERANLFTTALANIAPGEVVTVEIEYQQRVVREGDRYRLRVPTAVTPRYTPAADVAALAAVDASTGAVPLSALPAGSHGLEVEIDLDAGLPIAEIVSRHHRIEVTPGAGTRQHVALAGVARLDADFVLEWRAADAADARVAAFGHTAGEAGYALVQIVPPLTAAVDLAPPRELVLVLDTSGSMHGAAMAEAVAAVEFAIEGLRPSDRFNLIAFDNDTERLYPSARSATAAHRAEAVAWLRRQRADGGTEMRPALLAALHGGDAEGYLRQVLFVTDGAVGNEEALFRDIRRWIGTSRLFTVGIGAAPNGFFMRKAAEAGRGRFVLVGNTAGVREAMTTLFSRMSQPVLTDIEFDWVGADVEAYPSRVADLYAGEPLEISARFEGAGPERLRLSATRWVGGTAVPWSHEVPMAGLADRSRHGVAVTWARDKLEALADARSAGLPDALARSAMLEVAMAHHVVSEVTSLVAVDATPMRTAGPVRTAMVPGLLPRGATPVGALTATATPAPLHRAVGLVALLLGAWLLWLRRTARVAGMPAWRA